MKTAVATSTVAMGDNSHVDFSEPRANSSGHNPLRDKVQIFSFQ